MTLPILHETDGNVRRVNQFDEMRIQSMHAHEKEEDAQCHERIAIHRNDECVVRADELFLEILED